MLVALVLLCRTELGGMGGFYCNLEGQMEMTGPNCEVASSQASLGTLLAIKQRLRELHQLLLDPPKVGLCVHLLRWHGNAGGIPAACLALRPIVFYKS